MTDRLGHRGPDDSGYKTFSLSGASVGLGHRRLAIIDLSPLGHQPMSYQGLAIVYNGEIYNFQEIRSELAQKGYSFKSHSDTEVILAGFHCWGIDVVNRFVGMFAFALLDANKQKVFLVRDRVGVKPLYFYKQGDVLLFGSEVKAFHEHEAFRKELNHKGLTEYLQFGYTIGSQTIFENTNKVTPGCYVEIDLATREVKENSYWKIEQHYHQKQKFDEVELIGQIDKLLQSAINYRMVADVPVGLFLSGGYDSSMVAAILQKDRTEKIRTFTIGFHEKEFNEAHHAKKVAEHLGTDHSEYYCSIDDALEVIQQIPYYFDEPFADYSAIPTMLVSKMARQKVTVALSADGGDELFAGYPKYLQALKYQRLYGSMPGLLRAPAASLYQGTSDFLLDRSNKLFKYRSTSNKIGELIKNKTAIDFARINVQQFEEASLANLLLEKPHTNGHYFYNSEFFQEYEPLDQLLLLDFKVYLPDDLLVKVDRATMSVALEGREPLLDHRLIEMMGRVSASTKINEPNQSTKYLLRKVAHSYIPEAILNRPKMGFTPPLSYWLNGALKDRVMTYLDETNIKKQGIFHSSEIANVKKEFYEFGYAKSAKKIWNLLMFQMWYDQWMKA